MTSPTTTFIRESHVEEVKSIIRNNELANSGPLFGGASSPYPHISGKDYTRIYLDLYISTSELCSESVLLEASSICLSGPVGFEDEVLESGLGELLIYAIANEDVETFKYLLLSYRKLIKDEPLIEIALLSANFEIIRLLKIKRVHAETFLTIINYMMKEIAIYYINKDERYLTQFNKHIDIINWLITMNYIKMDIPVCEIYAEEGNYNSMLECMKRYLSCEFLMSSLIEGVITSNSYGIPCELMFHFRENMKKFFDYDSLRFVLCSSLKFSEFNLDAFDKAIKTLRKRDCVAMIKWYGVEKFIEKALIDNNIEFLNYFEAMLGKEVFRDGLIKSLFGVRWGCNLLEYVSMKIARSETCDYCYLFMLMCHKYATVEGKDWVNEMEETLRKMKEIKEKHITWKKFVPIALIYGLSGLKDVDCLYAVNERWFVKVFDYLCVNEGRVVMNDEGERPNHEEIVYNMLNLVRKISESESEDALVKEDENFKYIFDNIVKYDCLTSTYALCKALTRINIYITNKKVDVANIYNRFHYSEEDENEVDDEDADSINAMMGSSWEGVEEHSRHIRLSKDASININKHLIRAFLTFKKKNDDKNLEEFLMNYDDFSRGLRVVGMTLMN